MRRSDWCRCRQVIIAREIGIDCEVDDVVVESILPEGLLKWEPNSLERNVSLAAREIRISVEVDDVTHSHLTRMTRTQHKAIRIRTDQQARDVVERRVLPEGLQK